MGPHIKKSKRELFTGFFQVVQRFHIGISQRFAVDTELVQTTIVVLHPSVGSAARQALLVATENKFGGVFEGQVTQWSTAFGGIVLVFVGYAGRVVHFVAIDVNSYFRCCCIVRTYYVVPSVVTDHDAVRTAQVCPLLFPSGSIPVVHGELDAGRIVARSA